MGVVVQLCSRKEGQNVELEKALRMIIQIKRIADNFPETSATTR